MRERLLFQCLQPKKMQSIQCIQSVPLFKKVQGQSLVELLFVIPVLLIIITGLVFVGKAMYEAQLASDTLKSLATRKLDMADASDGVGEGDIVSWTASNAAGGNATEGSALDEARIFTRDKHSIVIGYKSYVANVVGQPITFDFAFALPVQAALLLPNLAAVNPADWEANPARKDYIPPNQMFDKLNPVHLCGPEGMGFSDVDQIYSSLPPHTYEPRNAPGWESGFTAQDTIGLAAKFPSESPTYEYVAGLDCGTQRANLTRKDDPVQTIGLPVNINSSMSQKTWNPPGAPDWNLTVTARCTAEPDPNPNIGCQAISGNGDVQYQESNGPPHGLYYDGTIAYNSPPGDFIDSCQARHKAEAQIKAAVGYIDDVLAHYDMECEL